MKNFNKIQMIFEKIDSRFKTLYSRFKNLFVDDHNDITVVDKHGNLLLPLFIALVIAFGSIVVILLINLIVGLGFKQYPVLGPLGDFFGGVLNPIFTFLTFFGLIITIVIQRMELRLARLEYSKTGAALNTQAIENTFFNVLDLHHEIVSALSFDTDIFYSENEIRIRRNMSKRNNEVYNSYVHGRAVFNKILSEICGEYSCLADTYQKYNFLQVHHNYVLGHYFRNLYQALKLVDSYSDEELDSEQKQKYASILRSQLSSGELALLYINCSEQMVDGGEFKNLLVRYRMLEHLPLYVEDGLYIATGSNVVLADSESIHYYLTKSLVQNEKVKKLRGAFGSNPVPLPENL